MNPATSAVDAGMAPKRFAPLPVEPLDVSGLLGDEPPTWIGSGGCGNVERVIDTHGRPLAKKTLEPDATNMDLVVWGTRRLEAAGWPEGIMPVSNMGTAGRQMIRLGPLMMREREDGPPVPRSLQHRVPDDISVIGVLARISRALAAMHRAGVAHGNLKPGNIFLDGRGGALVTDWAMGNMPGVRSFRFTDALLYQPPEQLRNPAGYENGDGFRWDVFSFGVMAFRLLAGRFPRCHETFGRIAPPTGDGCLTGYVADMSKVARYLESKASYEWPAEIAGKLGETFVGCIDDCLALDPLERPADLDSIAAILGEAWDGEDREDPARRVDEWVDPMKLVPFEEMKIYPHELGLWEIGADWDACEVDGDDLPEPGDNPLDRSWEWLHRERRATRQRGTGRWQLPVSGRMRAASPSNETTGISRTNPPVVGLAEQETSSENHRAFTAQSERPMVGKSAITRRRRWLTGFERAVIFIICALIAAAGAGAYRHARQFLPTESWSANQVRFPVVGKNLRVVSATAAWCVTSGSSVPHKPGAVVLPGIALTVEGRADEIRLIFRDADGHVVGDAVSRTVTGPGVLRLAATSGFFTWGDFEAYRIGGKETWTVQVDQMITGKGGDRKQVRLFRMGIPGVVR